MKDSSTILSQLGTSFLAEEDTIRVGSFLEDVVMEKIVPVAYLPQSSLLPIIEQQQFVWVAVVCLLFLSSYLSYLQGGMVWLKPSMIWNMCKQHSSFSQIKHSIRLIIVLLFQYALYQSLLLYSILPFEGESWIVGLGIVIVGVLFFVFLQWCALSLFSYLFFPMVQPLRIGAASFVAFLYMGQFLLLPTLLVWFSPKLIMPILCLCFVFYVIVRLFLIFGLLNGFFSKKFRLVALFLYLCAFEIAPVYFVISRYFLE